MESMESLAYPFLAITLTMYLLTATSLVLSILAGLGRVPKSAGYSAVGVQAVLTIPAFLMRVEFGFIYATILAVCAVFVFVNRSKTDM
jgi:hypothetical protein